MSEPVNTAKRTFASKKGKMDLGKIETKQGALSPAESAKEGKGDMKGDAPQASQKMDLSKVDNENKENYNEYPSAKQSKGYTFDNVDFDKLHDDFSAIKDSKKPADAGK